MLRFKTTGTAGPRNDFQKVTVGVVEIDTHCIVPMIDGVRLLMERVGPERKALALDARKNIIEL